MDADGARLLCEADDGVLDRLRRDHHQVGELVDHDEDVRQGRLAALAERAIGLGVDKLRWPIVVRPGDVLTVETEIVSLRQSRSRPAYGIIRLRNVTTNQCGEIVQTMLASAMVQMRAKACDNKSTGHRTRRKGR